MRASLIALALLVVGGCADDVRFLGHLVVLDEIRERRRLGLAHLRLGGVAG